MARRVCTVGDNYLPGSFNGVPFIALEATSEHGRRGAEGEFPFGENTGYVDLGRRIRKYTITAVFREDNHVRQAAMLIAACELPGPGVLVHPTRGVLSAACTSIHVSDNMEQEGGETHVDLEFVEGSAWPNGLSLFGTVLGIAVNAIIEPSSTSYKRRYDPLNVYNPRRNDVVDVAQDSVGNIADAYSRAIHNQKDDRKMRALVDLRTIQEDNILAADPDTTDRALVLGSGAVALELKEQAKFNVFKSFANWGAKPVTFTGIAGESQDAVYTHTRLIAAAYMAQAAMETNYARMNEALSALDSITTILDSEIRNARERCDNVLHIAIEDFKVQVQTFLYHKSYQLPKLVAYDFHTAVHPLVAAYSIYADAYRHRELEQRNIIDMTGRIGPVVIAGTVPGKGKVIPKPMLLPQ